jgi:hypothetical protein
MAGKMISKKTLFTLHLTLLAITILLVVSQKASAQSIPGKVGLVIQFQDGSIQKKCVEITKEPYTGYDVLMASGYPIISDFGGSLGAAVCKIDQVGCNADNCFCDTPNYWSYWHLGKDDAGQAAWLYSSTGSSNYTVTPGGVEGWRYGEGVPPSEKPTFEEICQSPTSTATNHIIAPSLTWTAAPTVYVSLPTSRPTAWVTAIIIDQPSPTSPPPTLTSTLPPSPTPSLPYLSPTPLPELQRIQASPTQTAETQVATLPAALESPSPTYTESSVVPTQTPASRKLKPNKKPTATNNQVAAFQKSEATATLLAGQLPVGIVVNNQNSSSSSRISKWILLLGGLAGFGYFVVFFCLLIAGLVAIYFLRRT